MVHPAKRTARRPVSRVPGDPSPPEIRHFIALFNLMVRNSDVPHAQRDASFTRRMLRAARERFEAEGSFAHEAA